MKSIQKRFIALLMIMVFALTFIGCKKDREIDEEFVLLTAEDIKASKDTIEIDFRVPSGVIAKALEGLITQFEDEWDGQIDVELVIESSGYDGVRTTTVLDLNNELAPTIVLGYPDHFAEYYSGGHILNIQPYVDAEGEEFDIDDFVQSYLEENRIADDSDDLYGLPLNKSTEVLTYNKSVFEAMNYTVPSTWQEIEVLGKQIIADVKAGKLDNIPGVQFAEGEKKPSEYLANGQFYPIAYDSTSNAFITMCRQWNAAYTGKDSITQGYALFDNAECKAGLQYFQTLSKDGLYAVAETFDSNYASDAFKLMKTLMTIGSSAGIGYNTTTKFDVGTAKAPYNANNPNGKYVIQQGTNMAILNQNTNLQRAAAWQLLKWLTSPEITAEFCVAAGGYVPVRESAYETDTYEEFLNDPALDDEDYSNSAKVALSYIEEGYEFFFDPAFVGSAEVRDSVGILMSNVIVTKKDINKAISDTLTKLGPSYKKQ